MGLNLINFHKLVIIFFSSFKFLEISLLFKDGFYIVVCRSLNHRADWVYVNSDPTSGNYYPINSRAYIKVKTCHSLMIAEMTALGSDVMCTTFTPYLTKNVDIFHRMIRSSWQSWLIDPSEEAALRMDPWKLWYNTIKLCCPCKGNSSGNDKMNQSSCLINPLETIAATHVLYQNAYIGDTSS